MNGISNLVLCSGDNLSGVGMNVFVNNNSPVTPFFTIICNAIGGELSLPMLIIEPSST